MNEDDLDRLIEDLVEQGVLIRSVDDSGEEFYKVDPSAEDKFAQLWEEHVFEVRKAVSRLFMAGMVDVTFSEEGPLYDKVSLTEDAFDLDKVSQLSQENRDYLNALIKTFDED